MYMLPRQLVSSSRHPGIQALYSLYALLVGGVVVIRNQAQTVERGTVSRLFAPHFRYREVPPSRIALTALEAHANVGLKLEPRISL